MKIVSRILLLLALFFIAVGDAVFVFFSFLTSFFLLVMRIVLFPAGQLSHFLFRGLPRHHQHQARKSFFFAVPIGIKIKYFSVGIVFCFLFGVIPIMLFSLFTLLPNPSSVQLNDLPQTTKIFDRNHKLLYALYANQNRTVVPFAEIPSSLKEATIAIEDKSFYTNPGFDIFAIVRAFLSDMTHNKIQGGSTITQQLMKSTLLTPEQSIQRKVEEIILSFWAEHIYSKDQILALYLNQVPYGGTAWGVEAAAQTYFGKDVKELDLAECAFLAGLPQSPTTYSPFGEHPTFWKKRQEDVLLHMQQLGYITSQEEKDARKETLNFIPPQTPLHAPHFSMYIKDLLIQKYGLSLVEKGGLNVITSLDLSIQDKAQRIVENEVNKDTYLNLTNGAVLITNPANGDILAMVGSADYNNPDWGNVNVTTSLRQPGSSIKIVTYAAALEKGMTAATTILDAPISFPDGINTYTPVNYDSKFHGLVTLRQALANSFNIPAVKTLQFIGIKDFVTTGKAMGVSHLQSADHYGLSVTLGSADVTMLDMATAYGTLANLGQRIDLDPILKVTDGAGDILEEKKDVAKQQVIDPGVAFILGDILADNTARSWEFGPNSPLLIPGHFVSVKTGTTNNIRDNWTIGYTPQTVDDTNQYVVTVWVGNNDNSPMNQGLVSGITGAAPIFHSIMTDLLANTKDSMPIIPNDILTKQCLGKQEYFVKGTENTTNCNYIVPTWTPTPTPRP